MAAHDTQEGMRRRLSLEADYRRRRRVASRVEHERRGIRKCAVRKGRTSPAHRPFATGSVLAIRAIRNFFRNYRRCVSRKRKRCEQRTQSQRSERRMQWSRGETFDFVRRGRAHWGNFMNGMEWNGKRRRKRKNSTR